MISCHSQPLDLAPQNVQHTQLESAVSYQHMLYNYHSNGLKRDLVYFALGLWTIITIMSPSAVVLQLVEL